jgi:hypothetical protein
MASLTDPTLNPLATTTQTTSTTAPDWYNNMLSGMASGAQNAITSGGVAGPSALQTQAYNTAPTAITAGQPALTSATNIATGAAGGPDINQFMNPYISNVVDEMGRLGQRNFNELLAPAATAGAAGSGQFGSRRGMQVYGNVARDVSSDILGKQTGALQAGYKDAMTAALQEQQNQNAIANTLGTLSGQAYTQGVGGLNALSTLGAQQQATEQARLNYPMTAAQAAASVMKGFTVPTSVSQTTTQPAGVGQMGPSPLGQIANIVSGLGSIAGQKIAGVTGDQTLGSWLTSKLSTLLNQSNSQTSSGAPEYGTGSTAPTYTGQGPGDNSVPYPDAGTTGYIPTIDTGVDPNQILD